MKARCPHGAPWYRADCPLCGAAPWRRAADWEREKRWLREGAPGDLASDVRMLAWPGLTVSRWP